ncbi:DegV family protein [Clostridium fallax]|uniref:EDD domain protein, DegV family n=1 Tax=Clostridium fallax TaxID=1533 RepID=A0A1M4VYI8_9CLOT|nr:DegV family protein [Clostridium fallax]SHE74026.1 EDD domain protein, DegV family [Clostridium fallax]SQB07757.1 degV family protein [Clostridium fallax]
MGVKIITDSTSYIPKEFLKKYDIKVASLSVSLGNEVFREVDIDNNYFYKKMDQCDEFPKSSQPSIEELRALMEEIIKNGDDVVCVFISSDMSGTYSTANMVKNMIISDYPNSKIQIIDSRTNCMQMGYGVLQGAKAAKEGKEIGEVLKEIEAVLENSRFLFTPDTLTYLKKGGRIGGASALLGNILKIRPILTVVDGKTTVLDKVRTKKKAVDKMVNTFIEDINKNILGDVIVHHINCEEEGKELANRIKELLNVNVEITSIGPVIGTHVGPGAIGIAYYTK